MRAGVGEGPGGQWRTGTRRICGPLGCRQSPPGMLDPDETVGMCSPGVHAFVDPAVSIGVFFSPAQMVRWREL